MSGLFNYPKTWIDDEVLTNEDLNTQFDVAKSNMIAEKLEGASTVNNVYNATKAIAQTDPYPIGPTNFAASVEDEIKRLRFAISQIKGTNDYTLPAGSVLKRNNSNLEWILGLGNLKDFISSGVLVNTNGLSVINTPLFYNDSGSASNGIPYADLQFDVAKRIYLKDTNRFYVGFWFKTTETNVGLFGSSSAGFTIGTNSNGNLEFVFVGKKPFNQELKQVGIITSSGSVLDNTWRRVVAVFDAINGVVSLYLDGVIVGQFTDPNINLFNGVQQTFFTRVNPGISYFYNTSGLSWSFQSTTPPSGFTQIGSSGLFSVSNGVASISCLGSQARSFKTSITPDFTQPFRIDISLKVNSVSPGDSMTSVSGPVFIKASNTTNSRSYQVGFMEDRIIVTDLSKINNPLVIYHDCTHDTLYSFRYSTSGNTLSVYINDVNSGSISIGTAGTASSEFVFGVACTSTQSAQAQFNFVRFIIGSTIPEMTSITTPENVKMSDVFVGSGNFPSDVFLTQLSSDGVEKCFSDSKRIIYGDEQYPQSKSLQLQDIVIGTTNLSIVRSFKINYSGVSQKTFKVRGTFTGSTTLTAGFALIPVSYTGLAVFNITNIARIGGSVVSLSSSTDRRYFEISFPLGGLKFLNENIGLYAQTSAGSITINIDDLEYYLE